MANVKSRPKAHKSATTKNKVCKPKHTSAGNKNADRPDLKKSSSLKSMPADKMHVKFLSPNDFIKSKKSRSTKADSKGIKDTSKLPKEQCTTDKPVEKSHMKQISSLSPRLSEEKGHKKKFVPPNDISKEKIFKIPKIKNKISEESKKATKEKPLNGKHPRSSHKVKKLKSILAAEKLKHDISSKDKIINLLPKDGFNKNMLLSKSGRIKVKNKDHFKMLDNILKSELMIDDNKKKKSNEKSSNVYNNNDIEITNQNANVNCTPPNCTDITDCNKNGNNETNSKEKQNRSKKHSVEKQKVKLPCGQITLLPMFECNYCGKMFTNKKSICRHIYVHLKIKTHKCPICSNKFSHRANMELHVKKIHADPSVKQVYHCQLCNKSFQYRQKLMNHLDAHIRNASTKMCVCCSEKFSDRTLLLEHEKQHMQSGHLLCSLCPEKFESGLLLAMHVKNHVTHSGYICQYCGKDYAEIGSMRRHLQVAHIGHRVQCPICHKKLKGHLSEHLRTHEKDRPHECTECGQRFTQSTQLNVHRRCHTGARPYPCRICKRCFTHSNALMLHIRRHTGEKPFACAMCPLSFSQLPHMKAHMRNIHGKEKAYKCQKCGQFYKLKVHLENHVKTCTVGDRELSFEEKIQASVQYEEIDSVMSISRMRFLLALLLTMIATQDKLKYLGVYIFVCEITQKLFALFSILV